MLVPSLMTLAIASVAACLSLNSQEEVFKVAMGFTAVLSLFLTLIFAPWILKLLILAVPLVLDKLNYWSGKKRFN
ncbi:MAG: riboflavin synthase subunit alpha [Xenococcaceae cyanobacterium]